MNLSPVAAAWRAKVLRAFHPDTGRYSHVLPWRESDFIDGMAWVGALTGAAAKAGDADLVAAGTKYLLTLATVGYDVRDYADHFVDGWYVSDVIPGYFYKRDPQAFAGPAMYYWARKQGVELPEVPWMEDPSGLAKLYVACGWLFGALVKPVSFLRQHVNSIWFAHLLLGKKPASTMLWMAKDNPFYSAIAGIKCEADYPTLTKWSMAEEREEKEILPMIDRQPSAWVVKQWPYTRYVRLGTPAAEEYTPAAPLAGYYLQETLNT
jgi:hypothetical protein